MTSKRTEELLKWDREHIVHGRWAIGGNNGIVTDKCHGVYFQDTEGKEYIDGASQLLCVNLGYGQTEIIEAVIEEKIIKFYLDAAEQSKSLLADVPRVFTMIAKKRSSRMSLKAGDC